MSKAAKQSKARKLCRRAGSYLHERLSLLLGEALGEQREGRAAHGRQSDTELRMQAEGARIFNTPVAGPGFGRGRRGASGRWRRLGLQGQAIGKADGRSHEEQPKKRRHRCGRGSRDGGQSGVAEPDGTWTQAYLKPAACALDSSMTPTRITPPPYTTTQRRIAPLSIGSSTTLSSTFCSCGLCGQLATTPRARVWTDFYLCISRTRAEASSGAGGVPSSREWQRIIALYGSIQVLGQCVRVRARVCVYVCMCVCRAQHGGTRANATRQIRDHVRAGDAAIDHRSS